MVRSRVSKTPSRVMPWGCWETLAGVLLRSITVVGSQVRKVTRSIFLVILLLIQEVSEWLIVLGSGSLVGYED